MSFFELNKIDPTIRNMEFFIFLKVTVPTTKMTKNLAGFGKQTQNLVIVMIAVQKLKIYWTGSEKIITHKPGAIFEKIQKIILKVDGRVNGGMQG